jgi:glycosyltransferase involved in cell wall biosynthesis
MDRAERERRYAAQEEFLGTNKPVNAVQPVVSVLVTTYEHARFIGQCLDGILAQETRFPFEVVIGEDESTDGTREICMEYARRYPDRVRLFLRSRALSNYVVDGVTKRLNGMWCRWSARGRYIALCEGDDYWISKGKLQKQIDFLESHADCSMTFHNVLCTPEQSAGEPQPAYGSGMAAFYNVLDLLPTNFIYTASIVYRRTSMPDPLPEWYYRMPMGDWPSCLLLARSGRIGYLPEIMSAYRIHPGGVWSRLSRVQRVEKTIGASEILLREFVPSLTERAEATARLERGLRDLAVEAGDHARAVRYAMRVAAGAGRRCIRESGRMSREVLKAFATLLWVAARAAGGGFRQALRRGATAPNGEPQRRRNCGTNTS